MSASDITVYDQSANHLEASKPFIKKEVLYQNDQNNSNYSGQIQIDCSSLSNSGRWLNYKEAYLEIPFMINMKSTVDITAAASAFSVGLKNGYYQLIESMSVDLNQKNIVQLQQNLNMLANYRVLTSFSQDDLAKLGPVLGVGLDTPNSYAFAAGNAATLNGDGYSNNQNIPFIGTNQLAVVNSGGYYRQINTTANALSTTTQLNKSGNIFNQEARSYYTTDGVAAAGRVYTWIVIATIRLKDICDWFNHVPLMKGANYRFVINYNSSISTLTVTTDTSVVQSSHQQLSGNTCPLIFPSAAIDNVNFPIGDTAGNPIITIACGVVKTTLTTTPTSPFQTCRLYVPAYALDPSYELNLIESMPVTKVEYNDFFTYRVTNIGSQQPFNVILTNGIVNPKYLVMIPFPNQGAAQAVNYLNQQTYQSLFDTAPATSCPNASITAFNIQVAGENVFNLDQQYDFSNFLDEFQHIHALNGSQTTGINSGLISNFAWLSGYRFYVADLSRRLRPEDKIPKSVLVRGVNNTNVAVDYICFIIFEKHCSVKTVSGEIIE